jgi:hypothetical protein
MNRIIVLATLVLAVTVASVAGARAGELTHWDLGEGYWHAFAPEVPFTGPVLAGGRAVWATQSGYSAWHVRSAARPGTVTAVASLPLVGTPGNDGDDHPLVLFGSPTRLAWFESETAILDAKYGEYDLKRSRVVAGPPDGPFTTLVSCGLAGVPRCPGPGAMRRDAYGDLCLPVSPAAGALALTDDTFVFGDRCTPTAEEAAATRGPLALRAVDLGAAPPATRPLGVVLATGERLLGAGGPYAVTLDTTGGERTLRAFTVADGHAAGTYAALAPGTAVDGASVQADGKLLLAVRAPGSAERHLEWRALGAPAVHRVALALPRHVRFRPDGGRLAVLAGDRIVARVTTPSRTQELVSTDLAGRHMTALVRFGPQHAARPAARPLGFAFDGARVAWAGVQCERVTVGLSRVGDAPATVPHLVCAQPRVLTDHATVDPAGRFTLALTCREGCHGNVRVSVQETGDTIRRRFRFGASSAVHHVVLRAGARVRRFLRAGYRPSAGVSLTAGTFRFGAGNVRLRAAAA